MCDLLGDECYFAAMDSQRSTISGLFVCESMKKMKLGRERKKRGACA